MSDQRKNILIAFNRLQKSHNEYVGGIGSMEVALSGKVGFEYSVGYQHSDGHVLLNVESAQVAHLLTCIKEIAETGFLSEYQHKKLAI